MTPRFTILTPVYNLDAVTAAKTLASVQSQTFPDWEWVVVDDCGTKDRSGWDTILEASKYDKRIRPVYMQTNGGISRASNAGLKASLGDWIALLDHDDALAPHALETVNDHIKPGVVYLYSDEDKISVDDVRHGPFFKPDWSPERLRYQNYCCHFSVFKTTAVKAVGGFDPDTDGAQDHDLILKVTEGLEYDQVVHIPDVLYHWRTVPGSTAVDVSEKPYWEAAGRRAIQRHLDRLGLNAVVHAQSVPPCHIPHRVERSLPSDVKVSIVIPTRATSGTTSGGQRRVFVLEAIKTALSHTEHANLEVVVVYDDPAVDAETQDAIAAIDPRVRLVAYTEPFNFSKKCNLGAKHAKGEALIFLNDDTEVISHRWVEQLTGYLLESDVGAVGAHLVYEDGTIQHAGIQSVENVGYGHYYVGRDPHHGMWGDTCLSREATAVTGAVFGTRTATFVELGGFREDLPNSYQDVDYCLKAWAAQYRVVWCHDVVITHYESKTRDPAVRTWEHDLINSTWGPPKADRFVRYLQAKSPRRLEAMGVGGPTFATMADLYEEHPRNIFTYAQTEPKT